MTRPLRLLCTALVGATVFTVLAPASGAVSGTTTCDLTLAPGAYSKVVVPAGKTCTSDGPVMITGGLFIQPAGAFVLGDESRPGNNGTITGGVHATNPSSVRIHFTTIVGGIDIHGGSGPFGGLFEIT